MDNNKEYYENIAMKGQAFGRGANIGWKKFMDITSALNATLLERQQEASGGIVTEEMVDIANEESSTRKQQVIDAIEERDSWYVENSDELHLVDKIISGLAESISNPLEIGAQIGLGIATGGTSIPVQLGSQVVFDVAQGNLESLRYEDRVLTTKENLYTAGMSIAPDLLFMGVGASIRKAKGNMVANMNIAGDTNVNPRGMIDDFDNIGLDPKSKSQQIQTDFPNTFKEDVYKADVDRYIRPIDGLKKDLLDKGVIKDTTEMDFLSDILRQGSVDSKSNKTFLQRKLNDDKINLKIIESLSSTSKEDLADGVVGTLELNKYRLEAINKGLSKKTDIQKAVIINNKYNNTIDNFAKNIKPTIDDYVVRWETKKTSYDTKGIDKPVKISLNREQIDTALNHINTTLETQKLYVQNEYINILNSKQGVAPIRIEDYVKEVGYKNTNIAEGWVKGTTRELDTQFGRGEFLENAFNDSVALDELGMKVSLYDLSSFENFQKKFGSSFDIEGDIKFDGNIFENLTKANVDEKDIIIRAMRDNPSEFTEFITNSKEVLDEIGNRRYANIDSEIKNQISDKFKLDADSTIKFIRKNREFIESEYNKLLKEIPVTETTDIRVWKKTVAKKLAESRKANAVESIKINQTVNKQNMLGYLDTFYNTSITRENVGSVYIKDEMKEMFESKIIPLYDGILKKPSDGDYAKSFADFISDLKKTRKSAKVTGEYKTIGELRSYFEEGQMSNFFTGITDSNGKSFLKTNAEMIRDIMDKQTNSIALFSEYGSVSPYVMRNKIQYNLNESFSRLYGKELSDAQKKAVSTAQKRAITMLENTQLGFAKGAPTTAEIVSQEVRRELRRGILGSTGIPEFFGPNYALSLVKAQKYGGAKNYINTPVYQLKKMAKTSQGDLPNSKYMISQLTKDLDVSKFKSKNKGFIGNSRDILDDVAFFFQEHSAKQQYRLGEAHSTSILHNMPKDFKALENEMKDLLRMNGITEVNYGKFADYTKKHIDENNLIVNINTLSRNSEIGLDRFSDPLRNVYYQLSDYIGDPMYKSKMKDKVTDEISQWYGMFRSFSRVMNADTFSRVINYVDANGVAKNRFGKTLINPQYIKDMGVKDMSVKGIIKDSRLIVRGISKDASLLGLGGTALLLSGYGYFVVKEFIQSDRTLQQKRAVIRVNSEKLMDTTMFLFNDKTFLDFAKQYAETTGLNPLDMMTATDLPSSVFNKFKKVYDTFTDEEKKTLGTNVNEGIQTLVDTTLSTFVSRVAVNWAKAGYKQTQGDIETMPEKIFGMSTEDMDNFRAYLRNNVENSRKDIEYSLDRDMKTTKAEIDYMEGSLDSYNSLNKDVKNLAEAIIEVNPKVDPIEFRTEFPIIWSRAENITDAVEALGQTQPIDVPTTMQTLQTIPKAQPTNEFDKLTEKKKNYFYMIMKYKGKDIADITDKDYDLFVNNFKDIKTTKVGDVLKDVYGIDMDKFNSLYKDSETRNKAIRFYK